MPYLMLSLSALMWSGNFVLSRAMHSAIPPVGLSFWRWAVALVILLPFGLPHVRRQMPELMRHKGYIFAQALLGVTGFNTLIYLAVQTTTAINAVLVNSCIPVIIVVISWMMYREKISARQGIGVMVSLAGVLLIISKGDAGALFSLSFNKGDLLVLAAAFVWAMYSANLKRYPRELHPIGYLTGISIVGVAMILPFYLWETLSGRAVELNLSTVVSVLYVSLFASVLAFIFWNRAVREVGANKAGPFIHLMPVFSTILAVGFLDEKLMLYHIKGILIVFAGIALTTIRVRR